MENVTNIDQRKPSEIVLKLDDAAALLWPLTEILNATKKRGDQD